MLYYNIDNSVEAFSTNTNDEYSFDAVLPQHQGHTALVRRIPQEIGNTYGIDALITDQPGIRIGVKTADCVPILVFDSVHGAIGAIHSGWKGTLQNIIAATLERMELEFRTNGNDIKAVIGPCIHQQAFEVGDELAAIFAGSTDIGDYPFAKQLPHQLTGIVKWHLDLPGICRQQLIGKGVHPQNIELRPECTWNMHTSFWSARRLGSGFGKQRIYNCIMIRK